MFLPFSQVNSQRNQPILRGESLQVTYSEKGSLPKLTSERLKFLKNRESLKRVFHKRIGMAKNVAVYHQISKILNK